MWIERLTLVFRAIAVVGTALLITFLALPSPIRSQAWQPLRPPNVEGAFAANDVLLHADRLVPGQLLGPEDVEVDALGRVYTGTLDGKIVRTRRDGGLEVVADTRGRPLGLALAPGGDLIVADATRGLLRVDSAGRVETLVYQVEGRPLLFTNGVDVARDGTIYFTDSSLKWTWGDQAYDVLEQNPSGRVLKYDPRTEQVTVLLRDLAFANGVALSDDESYLLVSETARYRLTRLWLKGERRNLADVFMDNLPGFPDNISRTERGTFWVALYSVRKTLLDRLHPHPFLKDCFASLPESLRPQLKPYGLVFEVDGEGRVLRTLQDPTGDRFRDVSGVTEHDGVVYIGSLSGTCIGRALPPAVAP